MEISRNWYQTFLNTLKEPSLASPLKEAAMRGVMSKWTRFLTTVVVKACNELGWFACAKNHVSKFLPISRGEYLGLDIMAFKRNNRSDNQNTDTSKWFFPIAVFELENRAESKYIAYSLWKVMCTRAQLRVVFCYRREPQQASALVKEIQNMVFTTLKPNEFRSFENTMIVVGSRNKSDTFPYGFFKEWVLDIQMRKFRRSQF